MWGGGTALERSPRNTSLKWCFSKNLMGDGRRVKYLMKLWCNKNPRWKSDFHFRPEFRVVFFCCFFFRQARPPGARGNIWQQRTRKRRSLVGNAPWHFGAITPGGVFVWRHALRIKSMELFRQSKTQGDDTVKKCCGKGGKKSFNYCFFILVKTDHIWRKEPVPCECCRLRSFPCYFAAL